MSWQPKKSNSKLGGLILSLFLWVGFGVVTISTFLDIVNDDEKGCADGGPRWEMFWSSDLVFLAGDIH